MSPTIKRFLRFVTERMDGFLLTGIALLLTTGLITLYSASGASTVRVMAQGVNMLVALAIMWGVALVPSQHLERAAVPLYLLGFALLVAVALFGEVVNGARRWLDLGFTRIQPSELMKVAVPMLLAWFFARKEESPRLVDFGVAALLLAVPMGLIARQPDLGTAILIGASGFYVLFLAGLSWRVMAALAVAALASLPVLWSVLHDYQRQRILTLLDPAQDPLGAGYHTIQSTIAVGSGAIAGKGWLHGTQSHLDFLPERTTDFIFAVYAEEFGFIGNLLLLLMYLLVIGRGLYIAAHASTQFGRLLAGAITLTFFTYAFVNMGMVSGILPVVGVPLPLISYGGTSIVTLLLGFGMLMSIHTTKKLVQT
ncbi:MAG: rod shape-determining protein RodA [Azospira oryzae]|nr:MAG: rod shape-determining protein RodA [Azospira oryzae]PZP78974.1 MAG: rod shape-determining protein RodA [Azospira oryzae]